FGVLSTGWVEAAASKQLRIMPIGVVDINSILPQEVGPLSLEQGTSRLARRKQFVTIEWCDLRVDEV
ncbi:MAG: hypothetical protein WBM57_15890, partial [Woeseiaceae bacterium]